MSATVSSPTRISRSLLDPWLTVPLKSCYSRLHLPATLPPEVIVLTGHLCAVAAAFGFAFAGDYSFAAAVAALGVALNHVCDVLDGTHARRTGQCRNGGELLDHFVDPLSFAYWITGISVAANCLALGIAGVICVFATAVLTNIRAKLTGEFRLERFGPTEFKALLIGLGLFQAAIGCGFISGVSATGSALIFLSVLLVIGTVSLIVSLFQAVSDVNSSHAAPDQTEWEIE